MVANVRRRRAALGIAIVVEATEREIGGVRRQRLVRRVGLQIVLEEQAGSAAKNDKVNERVGA